MLKKMITKQNENKNGSRKIQQNIDLVIERESIKEFMTKDIIVGIGFYRREDWERLLASASDRKNLEDTYDEWLKNFHKLVKNLRAIGIKPKKVCFTLDELLDYCKKKGLKNNSKTRSEFFCELTGQGRVKEIEE